MRAGAKELEELMDSGALEDAVGGGGGRKRRPRWYKLTLHRQNLAPIDERDKPSVVSNADAKIDPKPLAEALFKLTPAPPAAATVTDYDFKAQQLGDDPDDEETPEQIAEKMSDLDDRLIDENTLDDVTQSSIIPPNADVGRLFLIPAVHRAMRNVVSGYAGARVRKRRRKKGSGEGLDGRAMNSERNSSCAQAFERKQRTRTGTFF
ncbi:unnamed protein product [Amoebophrya sp. A25]|nr:unnamed protein product [Amoebophrya sp. A25]|eukprot:GSA25T00004620001.1